MLLLIGCLTKINWDPKIRIKYVDTKHHLADILTKGHFTRDEWNNLLNLLNISYFSSLCCAQNFSLTSCTRTMAKRMQEQKGDNWIVSKVKADDDEPGRLCLDKFFNCEQADCVEKPRDTQSTLSNRLVKFAEKLDTINSNHDAASSAQGWQKRCSTGRRYRETCRTRIPRISRTSRRLRRPRKPKAHDKDWPYFAKLCTDQMKDLDVNTAIWGNF